MNEPRPILISREWEIPIEHLQNPTAVLQSMTFENGAYTGRKRTEEGEDDPEDDDEYFALASLDEEFGLMRIPRATDIRQYLRPEVIGKVPVFADPLDQTLRPRVQLGTTLPRLGPHVLQPYDQGPVWDAMRCNPFAWPFGRCITLACGRGKTVLGLLLAALRHVPTLVVCHTIGMCEAWSDTATEPWCLSMPREEHGFIGGGRCDWEGRSLVFATQLGMICREYPPEFYSRFGLVIYDEGDLLGATKLSRMLPLHVGERVMLTATPERTDGNDYLYHYHVGGEAFRDLKQDLVPRCVVTDSPVPFLGPDGKSNEKFRFGRRGLAPHIGATVSWLAQDDSRRDWTFGLIRQMLDDDRKVLYLGERSADIDYFNERATAEWEEPTGVIHGTRKTPNDKAKEVLSDCRVIWAIQQIAKRGLNQPDIDTVVISYATFHDPGKLRQIIGRALRFCADKRPPLIVILNDANVGVLNEQTEKLVVALNAEGYEVEWYQHE